MTDKSSLPSLWGRNSSLTDPFTDLHREIDKVFRDFGRGAWPAMFTGGNGEIVPQVDVSETEDAFEVTAELPGVDEKDIDVSLADNMLTIKGEKKSESKKEGENRQVVERSYGMFQRTIPLTADVKTDAVDASFDKGVLKVRLPKAPEAKTKTHKVKIGSAA